MPARRPLQIGQIFGRLTVLRAAKKIPRNDRHFSYFIEVRCECGSIFEVDESNVRKGHTRSCGCIVSDRCRSGEPRKTHGKTKTNTYSTWAAMIQRCENPNATSYPNYGKRGIAVCERWKNFSKFLEDMGEKPAGMTLDRINNEGHYEPNNCRWVNRIQQNSNTRVVELVMLDGETLSTSGAMKRLGFNVTSLYTRMRTHRVTRQEAVDYYAAKRKDL